MSRSLMTILAGIMAMLFALSGASANAAPQPAPVPSATSQEPISAAGVSWCSPGQWTQVHWYVNPFWVASYRYQVNNGVFVKWRWFSAGVPPYWEGSFTTSGTIWTPPSWYTSVEFMCSIDTPVWITPA